MVALSTLSPLSPSFSNIISSSHRYKTKYRHFDSYQHGHLPQTKRSVNEEDGDEEEEEDEDEAADDVVVVDDDDDRDDESC